MNGRALVLGIALLATGCGQSSASTPPAIAPPGGTALVEAAPVAEQRIETTTRLPGELSAYQSVAIHARVQGFVEEVLVDRGSRVRRGQLLIRLSAPEVVAQRAEAEAKLRGDESSFERLRAAAGTPGAVAKHDLELAEATLQGSRARVQSLRTLEEYLAIKAPFDGVVIERTVHPGALVGPGGAGAVPLLRLEQLSILRLTVAVPEADAGAIPDGETVGFTVPAWPAQRFSGPIRRISHALDTRTRTMPVELDVTNTDLRLAPGMFAQVLWPVRRAGASLVVPSTSVVQTTDRTFVDRVRDGVIERVTVARGILLGERLEVFGALQPGELVLLRGSEELRDGARVQTRVAASGATPPGSNAGR